MWVSAAGAQAGNEVPQNSLKEQQHQQKGTDSVDSQLLACILVRIYVGDLGMEEEASIEDRRMHNLAHMPASISLLTNNWVIFVLGLLSTRSPKCSIQCICMYL